MSEENPIKAAALMLEAALSSVGYPGYHDPAKTITPPASLVGPPELEFETFQLKPTTARFPVFVMVAADEYAVERLWELPGKVAQAVDELDDAAVTAASPGLFSAPGGELPCYELIVEMGL